MYVTKSFEFCGKWERSPFHATYEYKFGIHSAPIKKEVKGKTQLGYKLGFACNLYVPLGHYYYTLKNSPQPFPFSDRKKQLANKSLANCEFLHPNRANGNENSFLPAFSFPSVPLFVRNCVKFREQGMLGI